MKRLGIFCMYDKDGIVDDYIVYLLKEINTVIDHLLVVCNGILSEVGEKRLRNFTDDIMVRQNSGFDMEAWRQGIMNKHDSLADYDELVLFNDSFYGPFYPFSEIFDRMDKDYPNADFWGLTIYRRSEDLSKLCPYGYVPEHLQSYFLVIRNRLFHAEDFYKYWKESEEAKTMEEAVKKHEVCFTKYFFDKGFKYAVYCDTRDWEPDVTVSMNHYIMSVERLLTRYHCPILKKKVLLIPRLEYLDENYGDGPRKGLEFIKNHTNYDTALIWQNILRIQNIAATRTVLGLDYVFPGTVRMYNTKVDFKDVVIVAHLYYEDLMSECVDYLCNAPIETSFVVTVDSIEKKKIVKKLFLKAGRSCEVRIVANRGRDLSALLVGCADLFKKFKYLCFVHDKKSLRIGSSICSGDSFFHMLWNNTLVSENFIRDVLSTFEDNPHLGLLVPPPPHHSNYRRCVNNYWTGNCFEHASILAKKLNIPETLLDINQSPPAVGSVFWCRTAALQKLVAIDWHVEDFPEEPMPVDGTMSHGLERIFPFAAQASGYYTGWVMTVDFAKDALENFMYMYTDFEYPMSPYLYMMVMLKNICLSPGSPSTQTQLVKLKSLAKKLFPPQYWWLLRKGKFLLEKFVQKFS